MNDTSPSMKKKMIEMIRAKTPQERVKMGSSMYTTSRYLVERYIKENNPSISKADLKKEMFLKFYGNDFSPEKCAQIISHLQKHAY